MNRTLNDKQQEIEYLFSIFGDFYPYIINNVSDVMQAKQLFCKIYRKKLIYQNKIQITNNQLIEWTDINDKFNYRYSYKRYDEHINYQKFITEFYKIDTRYKSKTFFTSSCMAAISTLLLTLKILDKFQIVFSQSDIYFETKKIYGQLNFNKTINIDKKILYLDSISKNFLFPYNYEDYYAVIIDTTCFIPENISSEVHKIIKAGKLSILLRSHTKLDMLATEFSSLGSIAYIFPKKISDEEFDDYNEIVKTHFSILGKFGAMASLTSFPFFIFDSKFRKINHRRLIKIKNNNFNLFHYLNDRLKQYNIVLPTHQKFVLVFTNYNFPVDKQDSFLEQKLRYFCEQISTQKIYYAGSFGFDYIAIDSYYDYTVNNYVIRISMNDDLNNELFFKQIGDYLNENL